MQASDPESSPPRVAGVGAPPDPLRSIKLLLLIIVICQVGWIVHSSRTRPPREPEAAVTRTRGETQQEAPTPMAPAAPAGPVEVVEPESPSPSPLPETPSVMPSRTEGTPSSEGHITFNQFVAVATALDSGPDALTAAQKAQAVQLVERYEATSKPIAAALQGILRVLNPKQRQRMANAPPLASAATVDADQDPFLESVYLMLRNKAGSTPAAPDNLSPLEQITDRQGIFEGVAFLETKPDLALSGAQARAVLDSLLIIRVQLRRRASLEQSFSALLTPAQIRASMRARQTLDVDGSIGMLMRYWLEHARAKP